ncbi:MAG: glycosyltransferase family 39 protein [Candidatus Marsarchaeota archaeon]|nr:glycosyltransferase family 39 protein [Candidatus Marsarchaeota archaeon]
MSKGKNRRINSRRNKNAEKKAQPLNIRDEKSILFSKPLIVLYLVILIAISLYVSYLLFSGPFALYDDSTYMSLAHEMATGTFNPFSAMPFSFKFITIAIWESSLMVFGDNAFSIAFPSAVALIVMVILAYKIGSELDSKKTGLLASLFVSIAPIAVGYTTRMLPDLITGAFSAFLLYAIIKSGNSQHRFYISLFSGFLAAMMIGVRMESLSLTLLLAVATAAYVLHGHFSKERKHHSWLSIKGAIPGFAIGFVLISAYYYLYSNRALSWIFDYFKVRGPMNPSTLALNLKYLAITLNPYAFSNGLKAVYSINSYQYPIGLFLDITIIASAYIIVSRNWKFMWAGIINIGLIAMIFFVPQSISPLNFITPYSIYFDMILPSMALVSAYAVVSAYGVLAKKRRAYGIAFVIVLIAYIAIANIPAYYDSYSYNFTSAVIYEGYVHAIKLVPNGSTVACIGINPYLECAYSNFFDGYSGRIRFSTAQACNSTMATGGYALLLNYKNSNIKNISYWLTGNCTAESIYSNYNTSSVSYVELYKISAR